MKRSGRPTEGFTVIFSVIPPRTTPETRSDQIDGTANLTCKDGTCQHSIDGHEPTYDMIARSPPRKLSSPVRHLAVISFG